MSSQVPLYEASLKSVPAGNEPVAENAVFWISENVYVCNTADGAVFLDLRRNRYSGVDNHTAELLRGVVEDWPRGAFSENDANRSHDESLRVGRELVTAGLLAEHEPTHKMPPPALVRNRPLMAIGLGTELDYPITRQTAMAFLRSYVIALWDLRFRSLDSVVRRVRNRKAQGGNKTFDVERAVALVSTFRRLRHWVFSGRDRCLLTSLTLIYFLARYDVFPTWVIGISACPWTAHSWVECEHYILDGTPERALFFTPIFAV